MDDHKITVKTARPIAYLVPIEDQAVPATPMGDKKRKPISATMHPIRKIEIK